jgi:ABC-type polysaccharide/polyol phosphate export permease
MAQSAGIEFLLGGTTSLGFFNSAITLSMALIFAAAGFIAYLKQTNSKLVTRLVALALIMVGLHFAFFILYVAITDAWRFVFLTEFWPIPLLGLGLSMLAHPKSVKT